MASIAELYFDGKWQQCIVHFYRNVFALAPFGKVKQVGSMLKATHAQEDRGEAVNKASAVVKRLEEMKSSSAATFVQENIEETFGYYRFLREHWRRIRTNNPMERIIREVRRHTRVVGCFPDGQSARSWSLPDCGTCQERSGARADT